jgi:integrase
MAYVIKRGSRYTGYYKSLETGRAKSVGTFPSRAKALNASLLAEEGSLDVLPEYQDTVATYIEQLMNRNDVRLATRRHYSILLKKYALPVIGGGKIKSIKKQDLRKMFDTLQSEGASPSTIAHLKTALSYLFRQAVDDEVIQVNPAHRIKTPTTKPDPTYTLEAKDFSKVLKNLPTEGSRLFARFLVGSGLRFGEATELRVKDFNFQSKEVYVRRSVSDVGKKLNNGERFLVVSATKNGHKRTVTLSQSLIAELKAFVIAKALAKEELVFSKNLVLDEGRISLPSESKGTPYTKGSKTFQHATAYSYNVGGCRCNQCKEAIKEYRSQYRRKDKAKGKGKSLSRSDSRSQSNSKRHLPRDRWRITWNEAITQSGIGWYPKTHDLRHVNATLLLKGGVDVHEVKERLGHQSITTTERYLHRIRHQQSKAAEVVNDFLE